MDVFSTYCHTQATYFHEDYPVAHVLAEHRIPGPQTGMVLATLHHIKVNADQLLLMETRAKNTWLKVWPAMQQRKTVWQVMITSRLLFRCYVCVQLMDTCEYVLLDQNDVQEYGVHMGLGPRQRVDSSNLATLPTPGDGTTI